MALMSIVTRTVSQLPPSNDASQGDLTTGTSRHRSHFYSRCSNADNLPYVNLSAAYLIR